MSLITRKSVKPVSLAAMAAVAPFATTTAFAAEDTTGHLDVYVDHSNLDNAVSRAESVGVNVVREAEPIILTGDSEATVRNTATATKYYADKSTEITKIAEKYVSDLSNYNSEVARNQRDADNANARMAGLQTNLAANDQSVVIESKQFVSEADVTNDVAAITAKIEKGNQLARTRHAVEMFNIAQNAMTSFQLQADAGNVKLTRETVTIRDAADTARYLTEISESQRQLAAYIAGLSAQTGTIPDDQKPTYKLYDIVVDPALIAEVAVPVTVYNYTPIPVVKPAVPTVRYHYYDIRSTPDATSVTKNRDGELINATQKSQQGEKVVQAMVNQTVAVETDNQPLPSERFDKYHDLTLSMKIDPSVAEIDETLNRSTDQWTFSYDKTSGIMKYTATSKHLVQINLNQNANRGTVGGTVAGQFNYDAPMFYVKLLKDDTTYQFQTETSVNHEYEARANRITVRTDSANPTKNNNNSKMANINGKAVLPGSINNYEVVADFDQYAGVNIDRKMQEAGIHIYDFFPSDAVELTGPIVASELATGRELFKADIADVTSGTFYRMENGKRVEVQGVTFRVISKEEGPEGLQKLVEGKSGKFLQLSISGHDHPFYKEFVEGGKSVKFVIPMTTKKIDNTPDAQGGTYNGNSYVNVAFQSDFGNEYKTLEVKNDVPLLDPRKDAVLSFANLTSLDIKANPTAEIEHGSIFNYRLSGSKLPSNLSEDTFEYVLTDEIPLADEYNGEFVAESGEDIVFKRGTTLYNRYVSTGGILKANSDISRYITQVIARNVSRTLNTATNLVDGADTRVTRVEYRLDDDFIAQIDFTKTQFQMDLFVQAKRIENKDGVVNIFNERINGIDFGSTEVTTNTKNNALDDLAAKLAELKGQVDRNDAADAKLKDEVISALSVVVRTITDNKADGDKAVADLTDKVVENRNAINNVTTVVNQHTEAIEAAATAIVDNKTLIANLASRLTGVETKVESNSAAVAQVLSTLTIYVDSVLTDADALAYATNHGVAPGSVKSITLNEEGRFVVTYNSAASAINGSTPALTKPANSEAVAKRVLKIDFYNVDSDAALYERLESIGFKREQVISVKEAHGLYTVLVNQEAKTNGNVVSNVADKIVESNSKVIAGVTGSVDAAEGSAESPESGSKAQLLTSKVTSVCQACLDAVKSKDVRLVRGPLKVDGVLAKIVERNGNVA